ncbi:MAG: GNAT family N-acetyltransferase [Micrococcaceae bacterium]
MMIIREYTQADDIATQEVFFKAVQQSNSKDYSPDQINAWLKSGSDIEIWRQKRLAVKTYIAEISGKVVGFTDVNAQGYINMIFVDTDYSGMGVATELLDKVTAVAMDMGCKELTAHVSITAKPFFLKQGFEVVKECQRSLYGVGFINYAMRKRLVI